MFNIFNSTPKFKFHSVIPGAKEMHPIIPSKMHSPSWVKSVIDAYKFKTSKLLNYGPQFAGTGKCPGIIELGKIGWIVTSWFDFIIKTDGKRQCLWSVPSTFPSCMPHTGEPIKFIDMSLPEHKVPVPPHSMDLLVKLFMPWTVDIPKGWNLLMLPVNYADDTRFQCSTGILKPGSFVEVNPQLFWNVIHGEELVKAGTPLCQLIPIPDTSYKADFEMVDFDENQAKRKQSFYYRKGCTFARNPNVV